MIRIKADIFDKAIQKYGADHQLNKLVEECSELIHAIMKYKELRGLYNGDIPKEKLDKAIKNVEGELADVLIITSLVSEKIFIESKVEAQIEFKINRLKERLKK